MDGGAQQFLIQYEILPLRWHRVLKEVTPSIQDEGPSPHQTNAQNPIEV